MIVQQQLTPLTRNGHTVELDTDTGEVKLTPGGIRQPTYDIEQLVSELVAIRDARRDALGRERDLSAVPELADPAAAGRDVPPAVCGAELATTPGGPERFCTKPPGHEPPCGPGDQAS